MPCSSDSIFIAPQTLCMTNGKGPTSWPCPCDSWLFQEVGHFFQFTQNPVSLSVLLYSPASWLLRLFDFAGNMVISPPMSLRGWTTIPHRWNASLELHPCILSSGNFLLSLLHNIDVLEHRPLSTGSLPESLADMVCAEWTNTTGKKLRPLNCPVQLRRAKKKHMTFLLLPVALCHLQILGAWKPYSLGACPCSLEDRFPSNSSFALSFVRAICLLPGIHVVLMRGNH